MHNNDFNDYAYAIKYYATTIRLSELKTQYYYFIIMIIIIINVHRASLFKHNCKNNDTYIYSIINYDAVK